MEEGEKETQGIGNREKVNLLAGVKSCMAEGIFRTVEVFVLEDIEDKTVLVHWNCQREAEMQLRVLLQECEPERELNSEEEKGSLQTYSFRAGKA